MYDILFSEKAKKQFKQFDLCLRERVGAVLERIKIRPFAHDVKRLQGTKYYRLRI